MPYETIEGFERTNLEYYTGDLADYSIVSDRTTEGSSALFAGGGSNAVILTDADSGVPHVPEPGDLIRFDYYYEGSSTYFNLELARIDGSNTMRVEMSPGSFYSAVISGGSWNDVFWTGSGTFPAGEWMTVEVDFIALDELAVTAYDSDGTELRSATGTSSTAATLPSPNQYGWRTGSDTVNRWVDNVRRWTDVEESVSVTTAGPTDVTTDSATLNGEVTDITAADSADVYFEWREQGSTTWTATPIQTISAAQTFSETLTSLTQGTAYEFRAVAQTANAANNGAVRQFETAVPTVTLSGTAVDTAGNPVSGALVYATDVANEDPVGETTSAADGSFAIDVPEAVEVHLAIEHDDGTQLYNAKSYPHMNEQP